MQVTMRHLMRRAYGAFRTGDISDRENLKDALAWLNFQNSEPNRHMIADSFHRLDPQALSGLPSKPVRQSDSNEYCRGMCTDVTSRFHWVDILSKDVAASLPHKITSRTQALFRRALTRWAEERIRSKKGPILWLAELDEGRFQYFQPLELLGDLGRYCQILKPEERAVIFTVEIKRSHKPTMIDAGFAFFWLAWSGADPHGMTLSLKDGQPTYKEWVVHKDEVKIVDAWPLISGYGSLVDDQLPQAYWDACRQRVRDRRNFSEGVA